jgi:ribosomal protein S18 acetylase RimI-like enzyme
MSEQLIWQLAEEDAAEAATVLARAFQDQPVFVWAIADPAERSRMARTLFTANVRHACRYGETFAVGTRRGDMSGVAYWVLKPEPVLTQREAGELGFGALAEWSAALAPIGEAEGRALGTITGLTDPWRYLAGIGVEPTAQGRGFGSTLTARVVADSRRAGLSCGLMTDKPANVRFYEKHGFMVTAALEDAGLTMWSMVVHP